MEELLEVDDPPDAEPDADGEGTDGEPRDPRVGGLVEIAKLRLFLTQEEHPVVDLPHLRLERPEGGRDGVHLVRLGDLLPIRDGDARLPVKPHLVIREVLLVDVRLVEAGPVVTLEFGGETVRTSGGVGLRVDLFADWITASG